MAWFLPPLWAGASAAAGWTAARWAAWQLARKTFGTRLGTQILTKHGPEYASRYAKLYNKANSPARKQAVLNRVKKNIAEKPAKKYSGPGAGIVNSKLGRIATYPVRHPVKSVVGYGAYEGADFARRQGAFAPADEGKQKAPTPYKPGLDPRTGLPYEDTSSKETFQRYRNALRSGSYSGTLTQFQSAEESAREGYKQPHQRKKPMDDINPYNRY